jgi:hypothetical protein
MKRLITASLAVLMLAGGASAASAQDMAAGQRYDDRGRRYEQRRTMTRL